MSGRIEFTRKRYVMSIAVEFEGSTARITLSGDIDYSIQDEIRKENSRALAGDHIKEIHVNLAAVTFLDSSGIRALLALQKQASEGDKSVTLLNCNERIREIFSISGFDRMFTIL